MERIEGVKITPDHLGAARRPGFSAIRDQILEDLKEIKSGDRALGVTMASGHRLFDGAWLSSPEARLELVGVVNRLDRAAFVRPEDAGACGEVRFIYRLSYTRRLAGAADLYTRLPMTVNVVYWAHGPDCAATAKAWHRRQDAVAGDAAELLAGPLNPELFSQARLKSVEINLQSVRWPSTIRPDLGGHAEYLMRVFVRQGTKFVPGLMENTPDPARTSLRSELLRHLKKDEVRRGFDTGTEVLPDKFLAQRAISVAFYGQSRQANRPFEHFVREKDLRELKYDGARFVRSPAGYLRRLNESSCMGCHQGRSIAGFHFVGIDAPDTHPANAIKVSHSAHLLEDLPRRAAFVRAVAVGRGGEPARPFAERPVRLGQIVKTEKGEEPPKDLVTGGEYGDHCGLGDDPSFRAWTCQAPLECRSESGPVGGSPVGVCLPPRNKPALIRAGDPCDPGRMTQNFNAHRDRLIDKKTENCGDARGCFAAGEGFPGGLCFGDCENLQSGEACGLIAVYGFNECLFQGKLFTECLRNHTGPISLRGCDEETPCRDDYICVGTGSKRGACIPPYFLFQLRLDGHVKPKIESAPARASSARPSPVPAR